MLATSRLPKKVLIFSAFFYAQLISLAAYAGCPPAQVAQSARVQQVYDGDTLQLTDGRKIRLIGLDTPEIHSRSRTIPNDIKASGIAARKALVSQLKSSGWQISLALGVDATDRYGRTLAHVYLPDGLNVQAWLIEEGYGIAFTTPPNDRMSDCYRRHEHIARQHNRGIWNMPAYQLKTAFQLTGNSRGFHRLKGHVTDSWLSQKRLSLVLDGKVLLKIYKNDMHNFNAHMLNTIKGRNIEVRGWLRPQKGKYPWSMVLRHNDSMVQLQK